MLHARPIDPLEASNSDSRVHTVSGSPMASGLVTMKGGLGASPSSMSDSDALSSSYSSCWRWSLSRVKNSASIAPRLQRSMANASYVVGPNSSSGARYGLVGRRQQSRRGSDYWRSTHPVDTSKHMSPGGSGQRPLASGGAVVGSVHAMPKSISFTQPAAVRRTLRGLMSRWAMSRLCRYAMAAMV